MDAKNKGNRKTCVGGVYEITPANGIHYFRLSIRLQNGRTFASAVFSDAAILVMCKRRRNGFEM